MSRATRVLVVDDEAYVRDSLREILVHEGFQVLTAADGRAAARQLSREPVDVVVADLSMPGGDGLELLEATSRSHVRVPVIMITGVATVPDAVSAMKLGAFDLLQKPVEPTELVRLIRRAAEHRSLVGEVHRLRATLDGLRGMRRLVGSSPAMQQVRAELARVAPSSATVLVLGESGTGKELAAEEIHRAGGRVEGPFVRVSCAGIHAARFESELFGHSAGAVPDEAGERVGRFEQAEGGTLVLDEIGTLQPEMQAKLLRVLDSFEYERVGDSTTRVTDARIVALTNEDLAASVERGAFRRDLYYRLNVFPVRMPALREHKEDLGELVEHLLDRLRHARPGAVARTASPEVIDLLASYDWPGNVRELENVIDRAVIVGGAGPLEPALIRSILESALSLQPAPAQRSGAAAPPSSPSQPTYGLHLRANLDQREKELLQRALAQSNGRKKDAAALLGVDARNLGYYLKKHGL